MKAHGALGTLLKKALSELQVGESHGIINFSFSRACIQECCDKEFPEKQFEVGDVLIQGGTCSRLIQRLK